MVVSFFQSLDGRWLSLVTVSETLISLFRMAVMNRKTWGSANVHFLEDVRGERNPQYHPNVVQWDPHLCYKSSLRSLWVSDIVTGSLTVCHKDFGGFTHFPY